MPHDHEQPHALLPSEPALRVRAIETLLVDKGLVDPAAINSVVDAFSNRIGPRNSTARTLRGHGVIQAIVTRFSGMLRPRWPESQRFPGLEGEHMVAVVGVPMASTTSSSARSALVTHGPRSACHRLVQNRPNTALALFEESAAAFRRNSALRSTTMLRSTCRIVQRKCDTL